MGGTAVVFVHGLFSSSKTWKTLRDLLTTDDELAGVTLLPFDYPTPKFNINPLQVIPDFDAIARNLDTFLTNTTRDFENLILVSHSQGGLVVQRYLAQVLEAGRGPDLKRVQRVIMFACPNTGSEWFLAYRKAMRLFWKHPHEKELRPLDGQVQRARTVVLNRAVHARSESSSEHPVSVVAYAGLQDGIVLAQSALDVFPETRTVAGDHFSIIEPDSHHHPTYVALKEDILRTISRKPDGGQPVLPPAGTGAFDAGGWTEEPAKQQRTRALAVIVLIAVVLVGTGFVAFRVGGSNGGDASGPSSVTGPSTPPTTTTTAPPPTPQGTVLDGACENAGAAKDRFIPQIEICVMYWCKGSFHTSDGQKWVLGRGQIKLRPLILNKSPRTLDVSIAPASAVRLLVSTARPPADWWQPPETTSNQGDHPISITRNGQLLWAIPPNAERDAVRIELPNNRYTWDGFATLGWDYGLLEPGQTAFKPLRTTADGTPKQEGDLVFDVPNDAQSILVGLAVVDRNDPSNILDFTPQESWPEPSDLNSF